MKVLRRIQTSPSYNIGNTKVDALPISAITKN